MNFGGYLYFCSSPSLDHLSIFSISIDKPTNHPTLKLRRTGTDLAQASACASHTPHWETDEPTNRETDEQTKFNFGQIKLTRLVIRLFIGSSVSSLSRLVISLFICFQKEALLQKKSPPFKTISILLSSYLMKTGNFDLSRRYNRI